MDWKIISKQIDTAELSLTDHQPIYLVYVRDDIGNNIEAKEAYGKSHRTEVTKEFIEKYTAVGANRYAKRNRQGLQQIISVTPFEEVLNALEIELAKWEEKRAAQVARQQTTQTNSAISKYAYVAGGIIALRWVTSGSDTCPWCKRLSGKKVGTQQLFVEAGQAVETDDDKKLTPSINIGHPPLHSGCDCFISPST